MNFDLNLDLIFILNLDFGNLSRRVGEGGVLLGGNFGKKLNMRMCLSQYEHLCLQGERRGSRRVRLGRIVCITICAYVWCICGGEGRGEAPGGGGRSNLDQFVF